MSCTRYSLARPISIPNSLMMLWENTHCREQNKFLLFPCYFTRQKKEVIKVNHRTRQQRKTLEWINQSAVSCFFISHSRGKWIQNFGAHSCSQWKCFITNHVSGHWQIFSYDREFSWRTREEGTRLETLGERKLVFRSDSQCSTRRFAKFRRAE